MARGRERGRPAKGSRRTDAGSGSRKKVGSLTWVVGAAVVLLLVVSGVFLVRQKAIKEAPAVTDVVRIETDRGLVVMELYPELMPVTVKNFEELANSGFYNGLTWHRVEDWVIQTGDPLGTGHGGSGRAIKLEVSAELKNLRGAVGMARSQDRNSASSQFYVLKKDADWLNGEYALFGKVVSGMDVIDKIQAGDKMLKVTVEPGR
jgi:peptidyl-prolyl cis-trans isomerase B (cyclophilin B)